MRIAHQGHVYGNYIVFGVGRLQHQWRIHKQEFIKSEMLRQMLCEKYRIQCIYKYYCRHQN